MLRVLSKHVVQASEVIRHGIERFHKGRALVAIVASPVEANVKVQGPVPVSIFRRLGNMKFVHVCQNKM
jgi:hypothetical protein